MTMPAVVKLARGIDELVPDVGGDGTVSPDHLVPRQNTRHQGACLGVQEGRDVARVTAPGRVAFGVRSVGVKDMMSATVCSRGSMTCRRHSWWATAWCPIR